MATKKRSGMSQGKSNRGNSNAKSPSPKTATEKAANPSDNSNVHSLNKEADSAVEAKDLNHKLTAIEETLNNLETRFYLSHQEFEQLFNGVNERSDLSNNDIKEVQTELSKLNSSYQVLDTQSERLVRETGRLALLIDKLNVEKLEAIGEFEQQLISRFENAESKLDALDSSLKNANSHQKEALEVLKQETLDKVNNELVAQQSSLDKQLTELKQSTQEQNDNLHKRIETQKQTLEQLQQSLADDLKQYQEQQQKISQQQEQKLLQQLDESNRKNSSAQQFLDQKQQAIMQQTEALATESESLKQYLQNLSAQTEQLQKRNADIDQEISAQKSRLDDESQTLGRRIDELSEKTAYEYQDLLKQNERSNQQLDSVNLRQDQLNDNLDQLDSDNQTAHDKIKQKLEKYAEGLKKVVSDLVSNQQDNQARFDELVKFDQKLALETHHLEQRTDDLEREEKVHQEKIAQLAKQTQAGTELSKQNQRQVRYVINRENDHFKLLSGGFLLLVIAIVLGILFSYRHYQQMRQADYTAAEQNELQKSAIKKNIQATGQLQTSIEQQQQSITVQSQQLQQQQQVLSQEKSNYQQLQQQMQTMQQQLAQQQQQIQAKDETIQLLSREVREVDDNLQYLNNSVGPYAGYNRDRFQGKLKGPYWLQQQPADNFTVQLLQVPQKQQLFQFIQRYGYYLTDKLSYYRQPDQNYVLAYGSFEKRNDAQQALDVLPGTVSLFNQGIVQIKDLATKP